MPRRQTPHPQSPKPNTQSPFRERAQAAWKRWSRRRVKAKEIVLFTEQLAILLETGTSLVPALAAIERQAERALQAVVADVRSRVEEGGSLAAGLRQHGEVFDAVYVSMVHAGESSGTLKEMLRRVAAYGKRRARLRATIRSAVSYPVLLTAVSLVVIGILVTFILPRFAQIFDQAGVELPTTTRLVLAGGRFFDRYKLVLLPLTAAAVVVGRMYIRTRRGRELVDGLRLRMPLVGRLYRASYLARILRNMGLLLESGIPLLDAVSLARQTVPNVHYQAFFDRVYDDVTKGKGLRQAFAASRYITPAVAQMIHTGEESGSLGRVMGLMADYYDEQTETQIKDLMTLLEPLIIVVMGAVVGLIAVSLVAPLFNLSSVARAG